MTYPFPYDPLLSRPAPGTARVVRDAANFVQRNLNSATEAQAANLRKVRGTTNQTMVNSGVVSGSNVAPITEAVAGKKEGFDFGATPGQYIDRDSVPDGPQLTPFSMFRKAAVSQPSAGPSASGLKPGGFYPEPPAGTLASQPPEWLNFRPISKGYARLASPMEPVYA